MADDLDMLYDEPKGEAPAPVPPPAPAAPSPEIEELRRELYQTKGLLAGLAQARPAAPEPQQVRPDPGAWQDREFLTEVEEQALLNSTKPREYLNKMFNSVGKTVQDQFAGERRKRDEYIAQLSQGTQQYVMSNQQAQATQHFQSRFYEQHADLKGDDGLVAQAAQSVAQEYSQAPWRFGSPDTILSRIGEVSREMKKSYMTRWGGSQSDESPASSAQGPASNSPARRAAMETGGSTRIGLPSPPKDGQAKALGAMMDHVKGRR